jgi:phage tail-like protein
MSTPRSALRLPSLLPAIYREDPFLGQYLWAFEQFLVGLEKRVDTLDRLFDPARTDEEFLPWLSSWVAFTLRNDLDVTKRRDFLAKVIPLYRKRGTVESLKKLIAIFTSAVPEISEETTAESGPHFFRVIIVLPRDTDPRAPIRQGAIARALIELEKPAHTTYLLDVRSPSMQIGHFADDGEKIGFSTVGVDTLIGVIPPDPPPSPPTD